MIKTNLLRLQQDILNCSARSKHTQSPVRLLAVSKGQPITRIMQAVEAGQHAFAESYLQEAIEKVEQLVGQSLEWHFIGRIQSNKINAIADHFAWVHSLTSLKHAKKFSQAMVNTARQLNVCVQVNISGEASKSGVTVAELVPLCTAIAALPQLRLRGLMTIPAASMSGEETQAVFAELRTVFNQLVVQGFTLDTLSMGMSNDYPLAIAEGATMVRVGHAIFGPRDTSPRPKNLKGSE